MSTEIGEYVVGAYLRICEKCDVVDYNARSPEKGLAGMVEIDVIGLRFADRTAFLCEVATHLDGLNYGSYAETISRVRSKYEKQCAYAKSVLSTFADPKFMLWSPRVPEGALSDSLQELGIELIINSDYTMRVEDLRRHARKTTKDIGNAFFRALQLLEHLRT